jgi:DNA-directed RNA polymerase specialized sigma24 family protein
MPSHRLMRSLLRRAAEPYRQLIETELCDRLLATVVPRLLRRFGLPQPDAEELALDAVLEMLDHPDRYQWQRGSPEAFGYVIAAGDARNLLRQRRSVYDTVPLDAAEREGALLPNEFASNPNQGTSEPRPVEVAYPSFCAAYHAMDESVQRMLVLRAEGLEHATIAEYVDKTPGAVMTAVCRARARLARTLN